jgi:hypothetical protein
MKKKEFKTIYSAEKNYKEFKLPYFSIAYSKYELNSVLTIRLFMLELIILNSFGVRTGVEISLKTYFPTIIEGKLGLSIF